MQSCLVFNVFALTGFIRQSHRRPPHTSQVSTSKQWKLIYTRRAQTNEWVEHFSHRFTCEPNWVHRIIIILPANSWHTFDWPRVDQLKWIETKSCFALPGSGVRGKRLAQYLRSRTTCLCKVFPIQGWPLIIKNKYFYFYIFWNNKPFVYFRPRRSPSLFSRPSSFSLPYFDVVVMRIINGAISCVAAVVHVFKWIPRRPTASKFLFDYSMPQWPATSAFSQMPNVKRFKKHRMELKLSFLCCVLVTRSWSSVDDNDVDHDYDDDDVVNDLCNEMERSNYLFSLVFGRSAI